MLGEKLERAVRIVDRGQLAELSLITDRAANPASGKGVDEEGRNTEIVELSQPAVVSCSRSVRSVNKYHSRERVSCQALADAAPLLSMLAALP